MRATQTIVHAGLEEAGSLSAGSTGGLEEWEYIWIARRSADDIERPAMDG